MGIFVFHNLVYEIFRNEVNIRIQLFLCIKKPHEQNANGVLLKV